MSIEVYSRLMNVLGALIDEEASNNTREELSGTEHEQRFLGVVKNFVPEERLNCDDAFNRELQYGMALGETEAPLGIEIEWILQQLRKVRIGEQELGV